MLLRDYTLEEFWEIFVDARPHGADAIHRQVNVQSKAVFSCAMPFDVQDPRVDPNLQHARGSTLKKL